MNDIPGKQPNWLSLPVEIWLYLLGTLKIPLRDLAGLCLTCTQLLSITRPILYHHLTLLGEKGQRPNLAVEDTFRLLDRNADLARNVHELTLDSRSNSETYFKNPGLVHTISLQNMTRLKRLSIIGDISRHAERQILANWIQIVHSLQLDELRIPFPGARIFLLPLNTAQLAQLANPKRITFYGGPVDHNGGF
jgi:hypothetical protein